MKRTVLVLSMVLVALVSCKKDKKCPEINVAAPAAEVANLRTYIQTNNITAVEDPRGFFYHIDAAGTGKKPTPCDAVMVNYVGTLIDGKTFDEGTNVSFYLSGLITGWQEAIPLVAAGGTITLYLPPSLAYGSVPQEGRNGRTGIPANSKLIFKIDLTQVY